MIFFLHTYGNTYPMYMYLHSSFGRARFLSIRPILYKDLVEMNDFPDGTYIFADLELLTKELKPKVVAVFREIKDRPLTSTLNDPEKTLMRAELLKRLYENKENAFNVYRCSEDLSGLRFPAFLRKENDHMGARTEILHDRNSLESALAGLRQSHPDIDSHEWLACEFCDTKDSNGIYRKYSSFIVGDRIVPRHIYFSRNWEIKKADLRDQELLDEEYDYIVANPHKQAIAQIAREASIDYGRIDYAIYKGRIQVWEFNTNPILLTHMMDVRGDRTRTHQTFARKINDCWGDLDRQNKTPPLRRIQYALKSFRQGAYYSPHYKIWKALRGLFKN